MEKESGRQMRFTEDELQVLRTTFRDNEPLLKVLRKMFLPEIDPKAPLGQIVDLWMQKDYANMKPEDVKVSILARTDMINFIETRLLEINILANEGKLSPLQLAEKRKKDSSK